MFNCVGSPYFEIGNRALGKGGRHIFISTFDRAVDFDIFAFFRGRHRFIGVDTLALDSVAGARIFDLLAPKFEQGLLKPFAVNPAAVHPLGNAAAAYTAVLRAASDRVILKP